MVGDSLSVNSSGVISATYAINDVKAYIQSRGLQLVTNGTGLLGNNNNFSSFTFEKIDNYYSAGSFTSDRFNHTANINEFIAVNPDFSYRLTHYIKANPCVGAKAYAYVMCYDVDKNQILPQQVMYNGTLAELTTDLIKGDTVVNVTTTDGWRNSGHTILVFWNYKNSFGYQYPPLTYSRNAISPQAWNAGMANGTTVTLRVPYDGAFGTIPAGTKVSSGNLGGAMSNFTNLLDTVVSNDWMKVDGTIGTVDLEGKCNQFKFRPGTAFIKVGWMLNRNVSGGKMWLSNVSFGIDYRVVT